MKAKTKAVCDTPRGQRDLFYCWRLGWSNHPRDIAAAKRILKRKPART